MKKTKGFILLICLTISSIAFCQSKVLENVIDIEVRSTVEITNNKQIVGYAFFYKIDNLEDRFFVHHFRLHNKNDINSELRKYMKLAYEIGNRKHVEEKKKKTK